MHCVRGGGLADLLHGRQQQADQDGDDGDHHQQLDQRERFPDPVMLPMSPSLQFDLVVAVIQRHTKSKDGARADLSRVGRIFSLRCELCFEECRGAERCSRIGEARKEMNRQDAKNAKRGADALHS